MHYLTEFRKKSIEGATVHFTTSNAVSLMKGSGIKINLKVIV